jgi:hypothetical protein
LGPRIENRAAAPVGSLPRLPVRKKSRSAPRLGDLTATPQHPVARLDPSPSLKDPARLAEAGEAIGRQELADVKAARLVPATGDAALDLKARIGVGHPAAIAANAIDGGRRRCSKSRVGGKEKQQGAATQTLLARQISLFCREG